MPKTAKPPPARTAAMNQELLWQAECERQHQMYGQGSQTVATQGIAENGRYHQQIPQHRPWQSAPQQYPPGQYGHPNPPTAAAQGELPHNARPMHTQAEFAAPQPVVQDDGHRAVNAPYAVARVAVEPPQAREAPQFTHHPSMAAAQQRAKAHPPFATQIPCEQFVHPRSVLMPPTRELPQYANAQFIPQHPGMISAQQRVAPNNTLPLYSATHQPELPPVYMRGTASNHQDATMQNSLFYPMVQQDIIPRYMGENPHPATITNHQGLLQQPPQFPPPAAEPVLPSAAPLSNPGLAMDREPNPRGPQPGPPQEAIHPGILAQLVAVYNHAKRSRLDRRVVEEVPKPSERQIFPSYQHRTPDSGVEMSPHGNTSEIEFSSPHNRGFYQGWEHAPQGYRSTRGNQPIRETSNNLGQNPAEAQRRVYQQEQDQGTQRVNRAMQAAAPRDPLIAQQAQPFATPRVNVFYDQNIGRLMQETIYTQEFLGPPFYGGSSIRRQECHSPKWDQVPAVEEQVMAPAYQPTMEPISPASTDQTQETVQEPKERKEIIEISSEDETKPNIASLQSRINSERNGKSSSRRKSKRKQEGPRKTPSRPQEDSDNGESATPDTSSEGYNNDTNTNINTATVDTDSETAVPNSSADPPRNWVVYDPDHVSSGPDSIDSEGRLVIDEGTTMPNPAQQGDSTQLVASSPYRTPHRMPDASPFRAVVPNSQQNMDSIISTAGPASLQLQNADLLIRLKRDPQTGEMTRIPTRSRAKPRKCRTKKN